MALGLGLGNGLMSLHQIREVLWDQLEATAPRGGVAIWAGTDLPHGQTWQDGRQLQRPVQLHGGMGNGVGTRAPWYYGQPRASLIGGRPEEPWGITKTIEWSTASNLTPVATDTTLAASTVLTTTFSALSICETLSGPRSWRSVKLVYTFAGSYLTSAGVTGTRVTFKLGSGTPMSYDRAHGSTTVVGRGQGWMMETDVTQIFREQWSNGLVPTATIAVSTNVAMAVTGHTCKLVITYAYDPAIQVSQTINDVTGYFRMKTIRIPVQSHSTFLTTSQQEIGADGVSPQTNQLPNLSTYLPEDSKYFYSVMLESRANTADTSTVDFTPYVQIGAAAEVARAVLERGYWTSSGHPWRDHFDLASYTGAAASINWRADVTARLQCICAEIVVTYAYRVSSTTTVMCEGMYPLVSALNTGESPTGPNAVAGPGSPPTYRLTATVDIPEPSPTIKASAFVFSYVVSSSSSQLAVRSAGGLLRTYVPSASSSETPIVHRTDDAWALVQGVNVFTLDFYNDLFSATNRGFVSDGYALVNYTTDLTAENYDGPHAAVSAVIIEGTGGLTDQLDAELCTRPICFIQHQIDEQVLSPAITDTQGMTPPRLPMIGDFWKITGAFVEFAMLTTQMNRNYRWFLEAVSNERGAGGFAEAPNLDSNGAGTYWSVNTFRVSLMNMIQTDSLHPYRLNPTKPRRHGFIGVGLTSWSWWMTVQNHKFTVYAEIKEDAVDLPLGTVVDLWADYQSALHAPNGVIFESCTELVRSEPTTNPFERVPILLTYAHDSYRDYFVTTDATTYPGKSEIAAPGNENSFNVNVYTAAPGGGGGLAIPGAGGTYVR